jgi:HEAT repeat protein
MLNLERVIRITFLVAMVTYSLLGQTVYGDDYEPVKSLVDKYSQASDDNKRKEVFKKLSQTEPKSQEDSDNLRKVFQKKDWDEILFAGSAESIKKIKDPSLDRTLIEILKDEKSFLEKASRKDHGGKSEKEVNYRLRNVEVIIRKLGDFKSQNAVPILKEYLAIQGAAYWASEALAKIGDKSTIDQIKEKAYKGEEINYGGQGSDEALTIVRDLEDMSKKDKWPRIAKQIINIRDPKAKPHLKRLLNHKQDYIRWEAASRLMTLADETDAPVIIEMSKNQDESVRSHAVYAMQKLKKSEFADELIGLLNDRRPNVRRAAAKALGYKKIEISVPYLEKAIKDSEAIEDAILKRGYGKTDAIGELQVREEAFIALYILTGKKYDYKGKTSRIDAIAERQKKAPSFY